MGKWVLALIEYSLTYVPQKAVKGQALADFLANHPCNNPEDGIIYVGIALWKMTFDGSKTSQGAGAGIVLISPDGNMHQFAFQIEKDCSKNQGEYEALIIGLEILLDMHITTVQISGDSQLVIKQLNREFKCNAPGLEMCFSIATYLLANFDDITLTHIPRINNSSANVMAQLASGLKVPEGVVGQWVKVSRCLPMINDIYKYLEMVNPIDTVQNDWRTPIIQYLQNPESRVDAKVKLQATKYFLLDNNLFKRTPEGLALRCLGQQEAMQVMAEVHEGICGAHQAGIKMRWLIRRHGHYWPSIMEDCIRYAKGCQACQKHGAIHCAPCIELQSIIKPWPFRGWAMDLIGQIHHSSSRKHGFIIVATDYFTKWTEAKPMKAVTQESVITFIKENIIHRFGLPQTITADRGTIFTGGQIREFAKEYRFEIINYTPYYAQANGQAEATNKSIKHIMERAIEDSPNEWLRLLSKGLWAFRTSPRSSTGITPYALTYGHDPILPMEITVKSFRVAMQNSLAVAEYNEAMAIELEDLGDHRLDALDRLHAQKLKVSKSYNRRVLPKTFHEGSLVWETILPIGSKDSKFGKWSPNWEGPFVLHKVLRGGAYWLKSLEGRLHAKPINGRYLKGYIPSMWDGIESIDRDSLH
ncbi:hypothetical protein RJ640_006220 [Escallonia rubra]|uniref:Integrase catalytic domain-containing protein n=1 Tax=Escallonia rubra TaxID=112253 RepID=A0AA88SBZ9_9ASTE|nr:hypothetical protein RJ640_006220 [Escallonia rubra]